MQGVHHVSISVPDIDVARRFYIDLLGAEEVTAFEWEPGNAWIDAIVGIEGSAARSFMARLKNIHIEVFEYTSPVSEPQDPKRPVSQNGYTHIGFQVDDIVAVHDRMVEAGLTFNTAPDMSVITIDEQGNKHGHAATYGRDFFGNLFEIMEIHPNDMIPPL
jgi:catechol 2,3-dioxygenase-like lactoylglutathione lyase family enzyme